MEEENNLGLNIHMREGNGLGLSLQVKVRIQVLCDVIQELCSDFGFPQSTMDILHKGIVERQILKSVCAHYLDENDRSVGMVRFNIDWEKYQLYADTATGKYIEIRNDRPLIEQFALWAEDIVRYVELMRMELNVSGVHVLYTFREEISNDPIAEKKAGEFLGLKEVTDDTQYSEKSVQFERKMSCVSEMLPELEIQIQSKSSSF